MISLWKIHYFIVYGNTNWMDCSRIAALNAALKTLHISSASQMPRKCLKYCYFVDVNEHAGKTKWFLVVQEEDGCSIL